MYVSRNKVAVAMLWMMLVVASQAIAADTAAQKKDQAKVWKPTLLSDGQPDIQGVWTTVYYGMGCLSNPANGDVGCVAPPGPRPKSGTANAGGPPRRGREGPSRILETPDGKIPYTTAALAHQQDLFSHYYAPTRPGDIDPQQRCLPLGPVRQFTWHDVQIFQYQKKIVLIYQGAEQYRVIYLDDRPHLGNNLKLWFGDSRGHWEGTTLVVDTTNNNGKGRLSRAGDFSSDQVHYVERFEFKDQDHFHYEALMDDPTVYTRPWKFGFDERRGYFAGDGGVPEGPVTAASQASYENWEEACHEGLRDEDNPLYGADGSKEIKSSDGKGESK
jgi:hypothetical protein